MSAMKQIAVRLPAELVAEVEKRKRTTFSSYVVEAIRSKVELDREAEIEASLACLAGDPEANDISDFVEAQRRVMSRED